MKTEQIIYCVVALLLGMLLVNMLKNVCGCKLTEGLGGGLCGVVNVVPTAAEALSGQLLNLNERQWLADKNTKCSGIQYHGRCINENGCHWVVVGGNKGSPTPLSTEDFRDDYPEARTYSRKTDGNQRMPSFHQRNFFSSQQSR